MKRELVLFGRHINMATQARRRRLVGLVYAGFAALMVGGFYIDRWRLWGPFMIIFSGSFIARLVFGGFGAGGKGMIKPFLGNEVRARYNRNPTSPWSRVARMTIPDISNDRESCSDEREVSRRDNAHEVAYRRLGMVVIATFLVAYFKNTGSAVLLKSGINLPTAFFDQLIYGLLIASYILAITLPQAILLWTEPDMDSE